MEYGKTIFTINMVNTYIKNKYKVLIIEISSQMSEIEFLLKKSKNIKKEDQKNIIKLNKKIDLILENNINKNEIELLKQIKELKSKYQIIIIDIKKEEKNILYNILKESDKHIILIEPNILQIKKSKKYMEEWIEKYRIDKEKIDIIFNKVTEGSLSFNILKDIYKNYNIIGKINLIKNCNKLINKNMNYNILNKRAKKEYKKIADEILKNRNIKKYYLNKIYNN